MTGVALAVIVQFLGPAREISHSSSASRDTAVPGFIFAPHRVLSGGVDAAVVSLATGSFTLRVGFFGMVELESEGTTQKLLPYPIADIRFWRGLIGYSVALSLDDVGRSLCDRCAVEATLSYRHESEHYTGSGTGGPGTDYSDVPLVGDFILADVAVRIPVGEVDLVARVQNKFFIPGQGGYTEGPGIDLHARWRRWPRLHPFVSAFAEYCFGADRFPDAYLVRGLAGAILPSPAGDIYLYLSADVGNRKGLAVFTREETIGVGARLAFF